jgi:hypothetical protein
MAVRNYFSEQLDKTPFESAPQSKNQSRPRHHIVANPSRKSPSTPASRKAIFRQSGGAVKILITKTSPTSAKIPRPLRCETSPSGPVG